MCVRFLHTSYQHLNFAHAVVDHWLEPHIPTSQDIRAFYWSSHIARFSPVFLLILWIAFLCSSFITSSIKTRISYTKVIYAPKPRMIEVVQKPWFFKRFIIDSFWFGREYGICRRREFEHSSSLTVLGFIQLNTRMTIVRLQDGSLWIHSPVPFTEEYNTLMPWWVLIVAPAVFIICLSFHGKSLSWAQLCVRTPKKERIWEVTLLGEDEIWDFAQQRIQGCLYSMRCSFIERAKPLSQQIFCFICPKQVDLQASMLGWMDSNSGSQRLYCFAWPSKTKRSFAPLCKKSVHGVPKISPCAITISTKREPRRLLLGHSIVSRFLNKLFALPRPPCPKRNNKRDERQRRQAF